MTSEDIKKFTDGLRKNKSNTIRIKGSQNTPTKALSFNGSRSSHYPAIEVDHGKQTDFYEFEKSFAKSKLPELIGKWILFSIHAKRKQGEFYLVVDDKSKKQFEKVITEKKLDIELVTIK